MISLNVQKYQLCININFFSVYINHRPAFGLAPSQISKAFNLLGDDGLIDQAKFVTLMQEKGYCLTHQA